MELNEQFNNILNEFIEKLLNSKKYDVKNYLSKSIGKKIRKIPEINALKAYMFFNNILNIISINNG